MKKPYRPAGSSFPSTLTGVETVNGQSLWIKTVGDKHLAVYDPEGHAGRITISNVMQSNGVIHSVDRVLMPK